MSEPIRRPETMPSTNQTHVLEDLRRRVSGRLHTPADQTWDAARTPWIVNIDQHPMAVLEVHDADDVVAAVRWAVDHGVQVTAQPTGHGAGQDFDQVLHPAHPRPAAASASTCSVVRRGSARASRPASCSPSSTAPA